MITLKMHIIAVALWQVRMPVRMLLHICILLHLRLTICPQPQEYTSSVDYSFKCLSIYLFHEPYVHSSSGTPSHTISFPHRPSQYALS